MARGRVTITWSADGQVCFQRFTRRLANFLLRPCGGVIIETFDDLELPFESLGGIDELALEEPYRAMRFAVPVERDSDRTAELRVAVDDEPDSGLQNTATVLEVSPVLSARGDELVSIPATARFPRYQVLELEKDREFLTAWISVGGVTHPTTLHQLVGIAAELSKFEKATGSLHDAGLKDEVELQWATPDSGLLSEGSSTSLYRQYGILRREHDDEDEAGELTLLVDGEGLHLEPTCVAPERIEEVVEEGVGKKAPDLSDLAASINALHTPLPQLSVDSLEEVPSCEFPERRPDDACLVICPQPDRVAIGLREDVADPKGALLHAIGHVALGHVLPGDEIGHWDREQTLRSRDKTRRVDQEVVESFNGWFAGKPPEEWTPLEQAYLGLWKLINRKLGEGKRLHSRAVEYQDAAYQRQAAQRLVSMLDDFRGGMLCDGVGLGKTYVATTMLVHYANTWREGQTFGESVSEHPRITILSPNSVAATWKREALAPLDKWGVPAHWIRVITHSKLSRMTPGSSVLERDDGDYSDIEHLLLSDLVIVDEAHNFRSVSAQRTKALRSLLRMQPRCTTGKLRRTLLLTATPINNRLEDFRQQLSLLFSRPLFPIPVRDPEDYRSDLLADLERRIQQAKKVDRDTDVAPLVILGGEQESFSQKIEFQPSLKFEGFTNLSNYLKEEQDRLQHLRECIRVAAEGGDEFLESKKSEPIASHLLDNVVVQRSRALCREIEEQYDSDIDLMFRPETDIPEQLFYDDEYDGTGDVLARFLPLFDSTGPNRLSFKVYMWHDIQEGNRTIEEGSPSIGLQRVLALKRLESSPVSFLISLLRLTVLHAYRLVQLAELCKSLELDERHADLKHGFRNVLEQQPNRNIRAIRWLSLGDDPVDPSDELLQQMRAAYGGDALTLIDGDDVVQEELFENAEDVPGYVHEAVDRLWRLKDVLLEDLETLFEVTPTLARIVFGAFNAEAWPARFMADSELRKWPKSRDWARRLATDSKIRALFQRLLRARRNGQKVIVFSQFTDTIDYLNSVIRAASALEEDEKKRLLADLDVAEPDVDEFNALVDRCDIATGDTDDRESVVNAFAPYYRIGPFPPTTAEGSVDRDSEQYLVWRQEWKRALEEPTDVLFSTDVLAEGVNLQDVAVLVNFDIHWNPVRMIQRSGRIDRRLNPNIERAQQFPELERLGEELNEDPPTYYWHENEDEAPSVVNMLLPDELELELQLRERIAGKSLTIDMTLGLKQGTGAEADWMEEYKYHGVSSLNAFQEDRAIEKLGAWHRRLERIVERCGIHTGQAENLSAWLQEDGAELDSPFIGSARVGRVGDDLKPASRFLKPRRTSDGTLCWPWTHVDASSSRDAHWLLLDGTSRETPNCDELEPEPEASRPVDPELLVSTARRLAEEKPTLKLVPPNEVGAQLVQGIAAFRATHHTTPSERARLDFANPFVLQFANYEPISPTERERADADNVQGIQRTCRICGHDPGMHKCCPQCECSADGVESIRKSFGFRSIRRDDGRRIKIPQAWCSKCRSTRGE